MNTSIKQTSKNWYYVEKKQTSSQYLARNKKVEKKKKKWYSERTVTPSPDPRVGEFFAAAYASSVAGTVRKKMAPRINWHSPLAYWKKLGFPLGSANQPAPRAWSNTALPNILK